MSYVVSIRRDRPITADEIRDALEDDDSFTLVEEDETTLVLEWAGDDGDPESFVLSEGEIDITTPSDFALAAAQILAGQLGARVVGEEGEDLTDVEKGNVTAGGCGPFAWVALLVAVLLGAYWLYA